MNRRDFLTSSLMGAAVATLAPSSAARASEPTFEWLAGVRRFDAPDGGALLMTGPHAIAWLRPDGSVAWRMGGAQPGAQLNLPVGVAFEPRGERIFLADRGHGHVLVLSRDGAVLGTLGAGVLGAVRDVAFDAAGRLLVCDAAAHAVWRLDPDTGRALGQIGRFGQDREGLNGPLAMALGADGEVHVADFGNQRVQVYGQDGRWRRGYGHEAGLSPRALTVDAEGTAYVADAFAGELRRYDRQGQIMARVPLKDARPVHLAMGRQGQLQIMEQA